MSRRMVTAASLAAILPAVAIALALLPGDGAAAPGRQPPSPPLPPEQLPVSQVPQQLLMRLGDAVRVEGVDVGCQVAQHDGEVMFECRRLTNVAGTYGTFIGNKRALVARFRSGETARVIFAAKQRGGWKACGPRPKAARALAADGGCG
jgi:hypothetical protein